MSSTFEDDRRPVTERIVLERLSEEEQLARAPESHSIAAVPEPLAGAATHAFVLTGWEINNGNRFALRTDDASLYPREQIETCFEALRLASDVQTGYAQIYMRPKGWAWVGAWTAHLPPVIPGPLVRRYPPRFDNFGWLRKPRTVDQDQARAVSDVFGELASAPPQLRLAGRRLSDAMLRDREDDTVVDLCIALEAALGEQDPTEITHKLALRTAAVAARSGESDETAGDTFSSVKRIYRYRSKVVHGGDPAKDRLLPRGDGPGVPIVEVVERYVRIVLLELLRKPELRDPSSLDQRLILEKLRLPAPEESHATKRAAEDQ